MSGGKNGVTLFYRILPATTSGLTSKTAVNWHLKVKDIEHDAGKTYSTYQKIMYHSQHTKNKLNS